MITILISCILHTSCSQNKSLNEVDARQNDSATCVALLGQMDALDRFKIKLQNAKAAVLANSKEMLATAAPANRIEMAKIVGRLLTKCCDVPQSTSGCGCGDTPVPSAE